MNHLMRHLVGCVHRVAYASLFSSTAWYACSYPAAFGKHAALQKAVCYAVTFPTAVIGRITSPYRGMDVFFDRGGEWCDFCSAQQVLWYHFRFAVPVYVALFYIPNVIALIIRHMRLRARVDRASSERDDIGSPE
jgi:hypothetical protein